VGTNLLMRSLRRARRLPEMVLILSVSRGFEARAPHRERYSSAGKNAAVPPLMKGRRAARIRPSAQRRKQYLNFRGVNRQSEP
jgi:hypothetical protein